MSWLIYGFGWLALALTLPTALTLIAALLPINLDRYLRARLGLMLIFSALPFACVRVGIWLREKKVSLPYSLDGRFYPFIEFPVIVALVALAATALAGPFPLFIAGMPIALVCAAVAATAMMGCELSDWIGRLKNRNCRE